MRKVALFFFLLLMASTAVQATPPVNAMDVPYSASNAGAHKPASKQRVAKPIAQSTTPSSYVIAPGVSVTPLYSDAPRAQATHAPGAASTQAYLDVDYTPREVVELDTSANARPGGVSTYRVNTGGATLAAALPGTYDTNAPTDTTNRFNMEQDGQKMTAQDFEAWMAQRGIRVVGGAKQH